MIRYSLLATVLGSLVYFGLNSTNFDLGLSSIDHSQPLAERELDPAPTRKLPLSSSNSVFAEGRVEGSSAETQLRFEVEGRVTECLVEAGQTVVADQALMRIDNQKQFHEVALAEANLLEATSLAERLENGAHEFERRESEFQYQAKLAELEKAQLLWQRADQLRSGNVIAQQEFDESRTTLSALRAQARGAEARMNLLNSPPRKDDLRAAQARVAAAQARLDLAKVHLDRTVLLAPQGGQVLDVDVRVGEITGPNSARPAVIFVDPSQYRVRAFVEELDAPRVFIGMNALISADGLGQRRFTGHVSRLSPMMSRKKLRSHSSNERIDSDAREVWIDLAEPGELIIGLKVDVSLIVDGAAWHELPKTNTF